MLKDDNDYLHDIIRILIDAEMAIMNGKYDAAYYLLGKVRGMDYFIAEMKIKVRDKLLELHGDKI